MRIVRVVYPGNGMPPKLLPSLLHHFCARHTTFWAGKTTSIRLQLCSDIIWTGDDGFFAFPRTDDTLFGTGDFGHVRVLDDMAAVSPTPLHAYGNGRLGRPTRPMVRRDSPLSALSHSQGFSSGALPLRSMGVGEVSDDDTRDIQPPPVLSALGRSVLGESHGDASPKRHIRPQKIRISRSPSNTPAKQDSTTPAPSLRVRRVGLQGPPVRRARRTPQGEDELPHPHYDPPPSQDQENLPISVPRPSAKDFAKPDPGSIVKVQDSIKKVPVHRDRDREHEPQPLAPKSANTPLRPAPPPPPPKMSVLDAATKNAGASTTKEKKRRAVYRVNGKVYTQLVRLGKGGSSDVYSVMAENSKLFALKVVKLEGADESAIMGYKGEINLLRKLKNEDRVVQLFDYMVDEEKQRLYVVCSD